jgi:hypothetical protein
MKKTAILAAFIAVIAALCSCSKDQYFTPAVSIAQHGNKIQDTHDQKNVINGSDENMGFKFGGGDDDKPIIMHRVINSELERLPDVTIAMIKNRDTLQSFTDSAGECTFQLPHTGVWELKIYLTGFSLFDTSINVTDSFSIRTTSLSYQ